MGAALTCDSGKHGLGTAASFLSGVAVDSQHYNGKRPTALQRWRQHSLDIQRDAQFSEGENGVGQADETPRYFHLLSDRELVEVRPTLEMIVQRQSEFVDDLYQHYWIHFGDSGTFPQDDFMSLFTEAIQRTQPALLCGDIDRYAVELSRLGELLAEHRVPLGEVIALLQLFNDSARTILAQPAPQRLPTAFDKLTHVQTILIVSAYSGATQRSAAADLPAAHEVPFHGLVGATAGMRQLYRRIEAAAKSKGNLLIVGESGTGKELVARAVHKCSARAERPFVALNCAALPKDLIESELFGYKRGAFSGATGEHLGLFRAAEGGTLFLDEVTEMSAETQSKLLRAIQERAIRPVGATREQPVDVRVIASTNRDPQAAVADGHLRQDLYYRLQAAVLAVPPLRERREDIPLLVDHFITLFSEDLGRSVEGIERRALDALSKYSWPGNVRELANAIESAFTFGRGDLIVLEDLPSTIATPDHTCVKFAVRPVETCHDYAPFATFAETERALIARALKNNNGNKVHTAAELKISRKKLYAKIAKYALCPIQRPPVTERDAHEATL
jgi:DNA-binding NtrC family response regulator